MLQYLCKLRILNREVHLASGKERERMAAKHMKSARVRDLLGQIMEEVYYKGNDYIVEKGAKEMAAIISIDEYRRIQKERSEDFKVFDEFWKENRGVSSQEAEEVVARAVREVRTKKRK